MRICKIFKGMKSVNPYTKLIVVAVIVAMIMGVFIGCEKEPVKASAPASEMHVLCKEIKELVKGLEYSDKVADDFVKMVISWKDAQGQPVLIFWKKKLCKAKEDYKQGKTSKDQLANRERKRIC